MRVVAGTARGRRIEVPDGRRVRPTPDRVREATFNALGSLGAIQGVAMLDLFAGSGALGIEALSRGAASAVFVDSDPQVRRVVGDNLSSTGLAETTDTRIVVSDVGSFLASAPRSRFGLVTLDPPYACDEWVGILTSLESHLTDDAVVVCESDREVPVPDDWMISRVKRYSGTVVTITISTPLASQTSGATP